MPNAKRGPNAARQPPSRSYREAARNRTETDQAPPLVSMLNAAMIILREQGYLSYMDPTSTKGEESKAARSRTNPPAMNPNKLCALMTRKGMVRLAVWFSFLRVWSRIKRAPLAPYQAVWGLRQFPSNNPSSHNRAACCPCAHDVDSKYSMKVTINAAAAAEDPCRTGAVRVGDLGMTDTHASTRKI
jgi:hypothetical protein